MYQSGITRILFLLSLISVFGLEVPTLTLTRPTTPAAANALVEPEEPICEVFCSDIKPRVSIAEISWKVSDRALGPREFEARLAEQTLEVTVYKDGFKKGVFANLARVRRDQRFLIRQPRALSRGRVPGLDRLVVVDVRPSTDRYNRRRPNFVTVRVEGLEPGLNYFWRVSTLAGRRTVLSEIVRCMAPVCPVDYQPGAEPQ